MVRYQNLMRKPELFWAPWARAPLGPGPGMMYPLNLPLTGPGSGQQDPLACDLANKSLDSHKYTV